MPLFDIKCFDCGNVQETFLIKHSDVVSGVYCEVCEYTGCHEVLPPLVAMQPDNMWHFGNTGLGNFSSKKEYNTYIKNNNLERATRENYESAQKKQANRFETVAKKNKENLTKFIEKEIVHTIDMPSGE